MLTNIRALAVALMLFPVVAWAGNQLAPVPGGPDNIADISGAPGITPTEPSDAITIYTAKTIVTLDPGTPTAKAVAVRDGKILGAGSLEEMQAWGDPETIRIDRSFENNVIVPGFIEAHMHAQLTGILWQGVYVGRYDRFAPDGTKISGLKTKQEVLDRIKAAAAKLKPTDDAGNPVWLIAWGYQPEFYNNAPLTRADLDPVSDGHPVFIENLSMHIYYANSAAFKIADIDKGTKLDGIILGPDGNPTGEIEEISAALHFIESLPPMSPQLVKKATYDAAKLAHRSGITTFSDLSFGTIPGGYKAYQTAAADPEFPLRTVLNPLIQVFESESIQKLGGLDYLTELQNHDTDRLSIGGVKFIIDGSVQGYTARILWPHYFKSMKNGVANIDQKALNEGVLEVHKRGHQVVLHTNGSEATEMAIEAVELARAADPQSGVRHRMEHVQMVTESQLERIARLDTGLNLFPNHIYYWGDLHVSTFLGADRARRMSPAASTLRLGIPLSLHSDASVTPVDPLFSMWVATTRETVSGRVLGEEERISLEQALYSVTLGAAHLLQQESEKGSITSGKLADFTILDRNPLEVRNTDQLKDIKVLATVVGGKSYPVTTGN